MRQDVRLRGVRLRRAPRRDVRLRRVRLRDVRFLRVRRSVARSRPAHGQGNRPRRIRLPGERIPVLPLPRQDARLRLRPALQPGGPLPGCARLRGGPFRCDRSPRVRRQDALLRLPPQRRRPPAGDRFRNFRLPRARRLRDALLQCVRLRDARLRDARLRHVRLRHVPLRDVRPRRARLRHVPLRGVRPRRARLRHARLRHVPLQGVRLQGVQPQDARLRHVPLRRARLRHVRLRHVLLRGVRLRRVPLRGVPLRGVPLPRTSGRPQSCGRAHPGRCRP
ncbi:pentapeptide repeat-containing protein [Luteimonas sp. 22616]|uniref:pentapeptide repeat-containing protein n=1 Tax=Luteimonas sp. 22616 TaxID=3453951 RepID=UPI003F86F1E8